MVSIKKSKLLLTCLLFSVLFLVVFVFAEENLSENISMNQSTDSPDTKSNNNNSFITTFAVLENNNSNNVSQDNNIAKNSSFSNESIIINQSMQLNDSKIKEQNTTNISLLKVFPDYIKLGDAQINLQIENSGETELKNIEAQVTGIGFSTYEVSEIESLKSKEKGYILVMGSFKKTGNNSLKIKIKEFVFYFNITVYDPFYISIDIEKERKIEEEKKQKINELSTKIVDLEKQYQELEKQLNEKKKNEYDLNGINLQDLKTYVRNTQASLAVSDEKDSYANYVLAENEYNYQKLKIDNLQKIERSLKQAIVDNAVLISTIVGGLVAMITLVEIVRRQKERVSEKFKNIHLKKENSEQIIKNNEQITSEKK